MSAPSVLFTFLLSILIWGCGTSAPTVATIGDETITLPEFEASYAKNNGGLEAARSSTMAQREEFLDLLVKFRLKVAEAKNRGIDKEPAIRTEIMGYELSVAESYIIEKELIEPSIRKLYDRKKEEIRASHILVRADATTSPADTLRAYRKAMDIISRVPTTEFDSLAARYSEEPNALVTRGELGYFSVGRMVPEFEDAAYSLRPGESNTIPVRSRFGYHVIKVKDRQPNTGPVRISFIILYYPPSGDTAAVRDTAWMLYKRLRQGENFSNLAQIYSQDRGSAMRGGDVGFYEKDRLPPEIATLLARTPKDSVAEPLAMQNGIYIFKVTDTQGIPSYQEAEKGLRQTYRQLRYDTDLGAFVTRLKQQYHFRLDEQVLGAFTTAFRDTTQTPGDSAWSDLTDPQLAARVLLTYDGGTMTVGDMLRLIGTKAEFHDIALTPDGVRKMVDQLSRQVIFLEHARHGSPYSQDFADLMDEYRDGILLYQIEQDEIWNRIQVNDSLLRAFYEPRKDTYIMPERVQYAEIYLTADSLVQVATRRLAKGEDFLAVAEDMTVRAGYRERKGVWDLQPVTTNEITKRAWSMELDSVTAPFRNGAGWSIIKVLRKDSTRTKTFEEASLEVTSEYQEHAAKQREQQWMESLREKYGVMLDREQLARAFTREERASE